MGLQPWGRGCANLASIVSVIAWLGFFLPGAVGLLPLVLVMLLAKRTRRWGGAFVFVWMCTVLFSIASLDLHEWLQSRALRAFVARMDTVVNAITLYEKAHGAPPDSLDELAPSYIPRLPDADLGIVSEFTYEHLDSASTVRTREWYSLGPGDLRADSEGIANWIGPDSVSVLVLEVNARGGVISCDLGRLPKTVRQVPFDRNRWLGDERLRSGMARDVQRRIRTLESMRGVEAMLGPPGEVESLLTPRWALRANLIIPLDGEELSYTPDGVKPTGVSTERSKFGRWKLYSTESN
jgi:hypothetical protein